ncbi:hypothetical protein VPH35_081108 [Triticum aestivum]|uniref:Uncharacterized protein n=2 Tax=Triticum TaxID=4564 RepID=A0A9R0TK22_TRITD|nr:unnamed protein product [Triticum turgidum subsp. durum]
MKYMHCLREGLELPELDQGIAFPGMDSIEKVLELVKILQLDAYDDGIFSHEKAQQPDVWRARDESFARKEKDTHCKKKHGKGAPPPEDSFVPMDDGLFHMLNVNGKVESLFTEQPPGPELKLGQGHGRFSNKAKVSSPSCYARRKMSTQGWDNKILHLKRSILDMPMDKLLHTTLARRQVQMPMRLHVSIINTSKNEKFFTKTTTWTTQKCCPYRYLPKDNIKVLGIGGTAEFIGERIIQTRMVNKRMAMLRPLILGMHMVQTCPRWPGMFRAANSKGHNVLHRFILSPQSPAQGEVGR